MLSNPLDDEDRFKSIIDVAVAAKEVPPFDAYYDSLYGRRDRMRAAEKEGKEALEHAKKLGVHDSLFGSGRQDGQEKKGLADLIQQRQKARAATFLDDLTAKYVNGAGKKEIAKSRKRRSEELEEDISSTARQRSKRGKLAKHRMDEYESESADDEDIDVSKEPTDEPAEEAFNKGTCVQTLLFLVCVHSSYICFRYINTEIQRLTLSHSQRRPVLSSSGSIGRLKRTQMLRRAWGRMTRRRKWTATKF